MTSISCYLDCYNYFIQGFLSHLLSSPLAVHPFDNFLLFFFIYTYIIHIIDIILLYVLYQHLSWTLYFTIPPLSTLLTTHTHTLPSPHCFSLSLLIYTHPSIHLSMHVYPSYHRSHVYCQTVKMNLLVLRRYLLCVQNVC